MNFKRFGTYLFRWQCSSPILAGILFLIPDPIWGTIVANFIGGSIFYWVDRWIFSSKELSVQWAKSYGRCVDCGKQGRVYRIAKAPNYNKVKDTNPEFRCGDCADKKAKEIL